MSNKSTTNILQKKVNLQEKIYKGVVVTNSGEKTVKLRIESLKYYPKYRRYSKCYTHILSDVPTTLIGSIKIGSLVTYSKCRRLSTLKSTRIREVI